MNSLFEFLQCKLNKEPGLLARTAGSRKILSFFISASVEMYPV
jgi:hypothetical protein